MLAAIGLDRVGFHDFRANGMLLPANDQVARQTFLPLHRGPHRIYNDMVTERVARVEDRWQGASATDPEEAGTEALFRLSLLRAALRKRLSLHRTNAMLLNRKDPIGSGYDFSDLDAMAESLWEATEI